MTPENINAHDPQDLQRLQDLITSEPQISSLILDNLPPLPISPEFPDYDLKAIAKLLTFLDQLGWVEHTGDWDPFLLITFTNGETKETEAGYWDFTYFEKGLDGEAYIEIVQQDEDGNDEVLHYHAASIKSIQILR